MSSPAQEIESVLKSLTERWNALELQRIRDLWDPDEAEPYYLPEESENALIGWEAIEAYWRQTQATITRLSMRTWDVQAKVIAPDVAVALYQMHWNGEVEGYPKPLGGDNRVTALFRNKEDGWRFFHYVEAPLAPMIYFRRLYELDADPDFVAS